MKNLRPLGISLVAAIGFLAPVSLSAQIINIDFLAQRGSESVATNYVGQGYAGGGTVFNGLAADDASESDNIDVSGSDLKTASGGNSSVGFSISSVGSDNETGINDSLGVLPGNYSYVFINSANNHKTSVDFTINGLGTATQATLYFFYTSNTSYLSSGVFSVGGTAETPASNGIYNSSNTEEYINVPVTDGTITGTFSSGNTEILSGLTIDVPEPSTYAMIIAGLGLVVLVARFRRFAL
jgi:hypothetical protein